MTIVSPIVEPIVSPIVQTILGGDTRPILHALSPVAGAISTALLRGVGADTFTRGSTGFVEDWKNIYREAAANEARFAGARRVENLLLQSDDPSHASWGENNLTVTSGAVDPNGGTTAYSLTTAGSGGTWSQTLTVVTGSEVTSSVWLKRVTGVGTVRLYNGDAYITLTLTSSWQRFSVTDVSGDVTSQFIVQMNGTADVVDVWHPQKENVSGASNTAPGEYIATTTAAVAKYYTTTNGNSVASNVVTEAAGLSLHPTVSKQGASVLARYDIWQATESDMEVGFARIPTPGSGTAGGNGFAYQITAITTGIAGSTEPVWPTTIGDTVVDNGVTWTNKGHYKLAGYLGEPAATNSILQSRQFDTTWIQGNTPGLTQDQDGIDGVANTAWSILDNSGSGYENVKQSVTVTANTDTHCFSVYILKDSDTSRFPLVQIQQDGGTVMYYHINTQTGESTDAGSTGTGTVNVEDHGLWWRVIVTIVNTSKTVTTCLIAPADATVAGTRAVAATGTAVFDQAQLELNTSVPSSPIPTTTGTVTKPADILYYDLSGNIEDAAGTVLVHIHYIESVGTSARVIATTDSSEGVWLLVKDSGGPLVATYDGSYTDGPLISLDTRYQFAVRWSGIVNQVISNGTAGIEGSYDGDYNSGVKINVGHKLSGSNDMRGLFSDLRIYNKDLGETVCEEVTNFD